MWAKHDFPDLTNLCTQTDGIVDETIFQQTIKETKK